MKHLLTGLTLVLVVPWVIADIRVTDDQGNTLQLAQPAQRIISLVPHATELLFNIGAGDLLMATVAFSDHPEPARALPRVGDFNALNTEAIIALNPDLLIAFTSGPNQAQINRLRGLGYPVFVSDPQRFSEIDQTLRQFGTLTGRETSANQVADSFVTGIDQLAQQYAGKQPLQVFYQVWGDPLITLNGETFVSEVIELCGGVNVFADLAMPSPQVSREAVIERNPDVIVTGPSPDGEVSDWHRWPQLAAIATDALLELPLDTLHRPTPGLLTGASMLCESMDAVRNRLD